MKRLFSANIRNLWVWCLAILCWLPDLAAAQSASDQSDGSGPKPAAAAQATPPSKPVPQTSSAAGPQPSASPQAEPEPAIVRFLAQQRDALGRRCQLHHTAQSGTLTFLACGTAGVWVVRLGSDSGETPVLVSQQDLGGTARRFFRAEDRLWVEINTVRAQPIDLGDAVVAHGEPAAPSSSDAPPAPAPARALSPRPSQPQLPPEAPGKVVSQIDEELLVALPNPVRPGQHIALIGSNSAQHAEPEDQRVLAIGEVTRSWQNGRARVAIGTNEMVPLTAAARPTLAATTAGIFAPPRAAGIWEIGFLARPFLILEDLGVGAMLDAYVGYRSRANYYISAAIAPLALGVARAGGVGAVGAFVSAAFDTRLFELGLGVGGQTVNEPGFALDPGSGLLLTEQLRVGARDGAHLRFLSYVALFHSNFQFSSLRIEAQIPLGARTWLRLAGGGGTLGFGFGEIGLRLLMSGNGGPGSFFFTTVAGWAHLFRDCNAVLQAAGTEATSCNPASHTGPMLGAGGEFRL